MLHMKVGTALNRLNSRCSPMTGLVFHKSDKYLDLLSSSKHFEEEDSTQRSSYRFSWFLLSRCGIICVSWSHYFHNLHKPHCTSVRWTFNLRCRKNFYLCTWGHPWSDNQITDTAGIMMITCRPQYKIKLYVQDTGWFKVNSTVPINLNCQPGLEMGVETGRHHLLNSNVFFFLEWSYFQCLNTSLTIVHNSDTRRNKISKSAFNNLLYNICWSLPGSSTDLEHLSRSE
jgi:hypothetical protein